MKKRAYAALLSAALLLVGCDQTQEQNLTDNTTEDTSTDTASTPVSKVLATVNGTAISQAAYDVYALQRSPKSGGPDANSNDVVLNEIINLELMRQEGINKGLDKKAEALSLLDYQRRSIMARVAIKSFLNDNLISDEQMRQFYKEQVGKGGTEYKAKHILLKDEADASQVIALLDNGGDFEELAKEKSTGPSGLSGGNLGWFEPGQMVRPFSEATSTLEKGSYSKTPVKTRFGWHVIYLEDTRESTPPPFDDIKDSIRIAMTNIMLQEHIQVAREASAIEIMAAEEAAEEQPEPLTDTTESAPGDEDAAPTEEPTEAMTEPAPEDATQ